MAKDVEQAKEFFGHCILPNKSPSPIFEQLLVGIYGYIIKHVAPWNEQHLSPLKLASFYRLVGGNFDRLFLESPSASLSFVYSSLGCQHTLHQSQNLFEPPTIPALTVQGFVRWQVIQILLEPAEHVPYLQAAVKRFEILNTGPGGPFPKILPAESFPRTPDLEMTRWHDTVGNKLRDQCEPDLRPVSRSEAGPLGVLFQQPHFNSSSPRRRAQQSPHSPRSGRHSSSDAKGEDRFPSSPHPLRESHRYERASVETGSSASSPSSTSPQRPVPRLRTPERSPRSYSAARHPYVTSPPSHDPMGRRHSSHGLYDRGPTPPNKKDSLSPQFYGQGVQRPVRPGNGPSPGGMGPFPAPQLSQAPSKPQGQFRRHRHTVSHDRKDERWRDRLTEYIGPNGNRGGAAAGRRRVNSDPRDPNRGRPDDTDRERRQMDGVRFADDVEGSLPGNRRASPQRDGVGTDYEDRRKSWRRARRRSEDNTD